MGGGVPVGSPEWSWNAAWDECHGVETGKRGESEGVWCAALQRGVLRASPQCSRVCASAFSTAMIMGRRPKTFETLRSEAPLV